MRASAQPCAASEMLVGLDVSAYVFSHDATFAFLSLKQMFVPWVDVTLAAGKGKELKIIKLTHQLNKSIKV